MAYALNPLLIVSTKHEQQSKTEILEKKYEEYKERQSIVVNRSKDVPNIFAMEKKFEQQIGMYSSKLIGVQRRNKEVTEEIDKLRIDIELKKTSYKEELETLRIELYRLNKDLREHTELFNSYTRQIDTHRKERKSKAAIKFANKEGDFAKSFDKGIDKLVSKGKLEERTAKASKRQKTVKF